MDTVKYDDPFLVKLATVNPLLVNDEQLYNIKRVLDYSCSDSRFSEKAYAAILHILTQLDIPQNGG